MGASPVNAVNKWCFIVTTGPSDGPLRMSVDIGDGRGVQPVVEDSMYFKASQQVYNECWTSNRHHDFVGARVQNTDIHAWAGTFELYKNGERVSLVCDGCQECEECDVNVELVVVEGNRNRTALDDVNSRCSNGAWCSIRVGTEWCFEVATVESEESYLSLEVDIGDGNGMVSVVPTTEFWKKEETVYSVCWHGNDFVAATVQNNELDSWQGSFKLTVNGQQASLVCDQGCDECDVCTVDASAMVVAGGVIHAEAGVTTRCSNGNACRVVLESVDCVQQWSACNEHCVRTVEATLQQSLGNGQPCLEYSEAIRFGSTTSCELGEASCPDSGRCISFGHNKNRQHQHCAGNEGIAACVLDGCKWVSSDCSHTSRDECRGGNCEWKYNPDTDDMACRHYQPKRAGENTCVNAVFGKVKGWTLELNVPDVNNCDDCRQACIYLGDQLAFAWRLHSKECRCYNGNLIREKDVSWWLVDQL